MDEFDSQPEDKDNFESIQDVYNRMIEAVSNENESGDHLLPYESTAMDYIVDQIDNMKKGLLKNKDKFSPFEIELHSIELERFSYIVNAYLRTRLRKIEDTAPYLIQLMINNKERANILLSPLEAKYLDRYNDSINDYMKDVVLKDMPDNMKKFRLADMASKIDREARSKYVFVTSKTSCVIEDNDMQIVMEPGTCRILTMATVLNLLESGRRDILLI